MSVSVVAEFKCVYYDCECAAEMATTSLLVKLLLVTEGSNVA